MDSTAFIYRYDPKNPWSHRNNQAPYGSCVERGPRKRTPKMNKVYLVKKRTSAMRRNAPFRNLTVMTMECCRKACLTGITKHEIHLQRQSIYRQDYHSQNYTIASNFKFQTLFSGQSRVIYTLPNLGVVCKTAFKKVFGISDKKIIVLLKKQNVGELALEKDQRGKHKRNARKLLPSVVDLVINFIRKYDAQPSHYRRKSTSKLYFDSKYSLRGVWKSFIAKYPNLKSNRLQKKNKGPPLSYSAFRKIFMEKMSNQYSFRKARVDTCQKCDMFNRRIQVLERALVGETRDKRQLQDELLEIKTDLQKHLEESEIRYGAIAYDTNVLAAST